MTLITYQGELAAVAGARHVYIADPTLRATPDSDPHRQFVLAMGLFAVEVEQGRQRGPYTDDRAEAFARARLLPDHYFLRHAAGRSDERLAAAFNAPVDHVRRRRTELHAQAENEERMRSSE